ncbi:MAG: molecular chaperone GroEL [Methanogenium sp.]|jgi:chaperonin GroEL
MKQKILTFGEEARKALKRGVDQLADAVQTTMGPKGRNVLVQRDYGRAKISKDGKYVASSIKLKDPIEARGAELLQEAAEKTDDVVSDGTTATTVITRAIVTEGLKSLSAGINPLLIKRGLDKAKDAVIEFVKKSAKDSVTEDDIRRIASISANDPKIGDIIASMIQEIGRTSIITVKESQKPGVETECVKGFRIDKGYYSQYMINDVEKMQTVLDDIQVFMTDGKLTNVRQVVSIVEPLAQAGKRFGVIICEDITADALSFLAANILQGKFFTLVIKAPGYGEQKNEMLKDLSAVSGAKMHIHETGKKLEDNKVDISEFGVFDRIVCTRDYTTFIGGHGKQEDVDARVESIRTMISRADSKIDTTRLNDRLSKLLGGIGVINVGGNTDVETKELLHRVEDAVGSTKAAIEGGYVSGGGLALVEAANSESLVDLQGTLCEEEAVGVAILKKALKYPMKVIAENAGFNGEVVIGKVEQNILEGADGVKNYGFDALNCAYTDMIEAGIIDPAKVVISALENAVSVASLILTTECVITDDASDKKVEEEM